MNSRYDQRHEAGGDDQPIHVGSFRCDVAIATRDEPDSVRNVETAALASLPIAAGFARRPSPCLGALSEVGRFPPLNCRRWFAAAGSFSSFGSLSMLSAKTASTITRAALPEAVGSLRAARRDLLTLPRDIV
jgi:hypothetical protein